MLWTPAISRPACRLLLAYNQCTWPPGPAPLSRCLYSSFPLPRLPVPPLAQTMDRYLHALEPMVSPEELEQTRNMVEEFCSRGGVGEALQAKLEKRASKMENWLTEWWQQSEYLESRLPLAVHSSPAVVLPKQDFNTWRGQLRFAAKLIAGMLDFKAKVDRHTLLAEYMRGRPLCLDQYNKIFSSCRVPGPKHDSVLLCSRSRKPPMHVTVVRNYQFFQLDVYNSDGTPLTVDQIQLQLLQIRNNSWKTDKEPLGVLTSDHRHTWGEAYSTLMRDKLNRDSVRAIQRSIFTVCLDASVLKLAEGKYSSGTAAQMLHGGGSYANSGNRWFDKTLQFIVGEDGSCGLVYEASTAEGPPVATILDHVLDYCKSPDTVRSPMIRLPMPKKLYFYITPEIKRDIEHAKQNLDILINDLDITCFTYRGFGKNLPKKHTLSPDSFLQMGLQLAYYRMYGYLCATCETASLRMFHLGRTDTIRSASQEALELVQAMDDPVKKAEEKLGLLKKAVHAHSAYTEQALLGQAIDRHLLGLKLQAIETGSRVPEIFMDTSYAVANHWKISTGQEIRHRSKVWSSGAMISAYVYCQSQMEP
ncbi:carnitine O-acetyltransferase-like isoform X2 [Ambystoma mexicanum]|uniref:carnitine O-acetyltransferase-like isoform X2 n=1 Tax=Ambystoma mexicanum TaxID=8296 RepID=UPI0037E8AF8A